MRRLRYVGLAVLALAVFIAVPAGYLAPPQAIEAEPHGMLPKAMLEPPRLPPLTTAANTAQKAKDTASAPAPARKPAENRSSKLLKPGETTPGLTSRLRRPGPLPERRATPAAEPAAPKMRVRRYGKRVRAIRYERPRHLKRKGLRSLADVELGGGLPRLGFPEQRHFPPYYHFPRHWAAGPSCSSGARIHIRRLAGIDSYARPWLRPDRARWCGDFSGGLTVRQGSQWGSHIPPGLTVEQGSPWRGHIAGGRTAQRGSPWRSRIAPGLTVENGSPWASPLKNWTFRGYDPARFPAQRAGRAAKPFAAPLRLSSRVVPLRVKRKPKKVKSAIPTTPPGKAPWAGRMKSGPTFKGSPWAR